MIEQLAPRRRRKASRSSRWRRSGCANAIGMTNSTYQQPLPPARRKAGGALCLSRAIDGAAPGVFARNRPRRVCGTTSTDLAKFAIEVQLTLAGKSQRVLSKTSMQEMVTPVGVEPAMPLASRWSTTARAGTSPMAAATGVFQMHDLIAHRARGYGVAIMTNGDNGSALAREIRDRVARAYNWDSLFKQLVR